MMCQTKDPPVFDDDSETTCEIDIVTEIINKALNE